MGKYDGRTAVITGGSGGIGLAMARFLDGEGARVLITGRDKNTLDAARETLGPHALTMVSDSADSNDIDALGERVEREFGTFGALFVNAGVGGRAPYREMTEETYDRVFSVNTKGAYFTIQRLAPLLAPGAGIVLTTSAAAAMGLPGSSAYAASKAALRSMARNFARELLPRDIRVNAVMPGPVDTGSLEKTMSRQDADRIRAGYVAITPMGRLGRPSEIAVAAAFLAFEATFTTGAELPVDGGGTQL